MNDPLLEKGLPSNVEAERAMLGAILLNNSVCDQAISYLDPSDFFLDSHRRIFEKMIMLRAQGELIDLITLNNQLRRFNQFEQIGGATYIASLIDGVPRTDTIECYARIVKSKARERSAINQLHDAVSGIFNGEDTLGTILHRIGSRYVVLHLQRSKDNLSIQFC